MSTSPSKPRGKGKAYLLSSIPNPITFLLFSPLGTAPLLYTLLKHPSKLRSILPTRLHPYIDSPTTIKVVTVLLGIGLVRALNRKLGQWTVNNWLGDAKFVKSQEVVLISGGSSGIGAVMAGRFEGMGCKVVVLDLVPPKGDLGSNVTYYQCDVTSPSSISSVATEIRRDVGDPTVLINNAGVAFARTILGATEKHIRTTFEVNTMSHFWMVREFLPAMVKLNKGHVVTVASMASYMVHAQNVDYSCSKASALAFHEGLASELRSRYGAPGVRTTVVNPIWVRTPLIEPLIGQPGFKDPVLEVGDVADAIVKQVVSGRSGQLILPEEVSFLSTIRGWPAWLQTGLRNRMAPLLNFTEEEIAAFDR